jgi:hypothetical protein
VVVSSTVVVVSSAEVVFSAVVSAGDVSHAAIESVNININKIHTIFFIKSLLARLFGDWAILL